jgi:membrane protease YdiL (CAAX protease family)
MTAPIKIVKRCLEQQLRLGTTYAIPTFIVLVIFAQILYASWRQNTELHAFAYLATVWLGILTTDVVVASWPRSGIGFPIRHGAWNETVLILSNTLLGALFLVIRFSHYWPSVHGTPKLMLLSLLVFTFPIFLALAYACFYRYRPGDLGFNFHYWYLALVIGALFGTATLATVPQLSHWRSYFHSLGFLSALYTGLITAGLAEEFTRMLIQTRLTAALRNSGWGFLIAAIIWSSLHAPVNLSQAPHTSFPTILIQSTHLVPIGLLWGYMTHRTKSILLSTFAHGLNLWGLQNGI